MTEIKHNSRTFLNARNQIVVRVRWNKKKSEVGFSIGVSADMQRIEGVGERIDRTQQ